VVEVVVLVPYWDQVEQVDLVVVEQEELMLKVELVQLIQVVVEVDQIQIQVQTLQVELVEQV